MRIRTQETNQKWETWEYEIEVELPDAFMDWNGEDQYSWLSNNCVSADMVDSEYCSLGSVDEIDILE